MSLQPGQGKDLAHQQFLTWNQGLGEGPNQQTPKNGEPQLPPAAPSMQSGGGFQTDGELQTKPPAAPSMELGVPIKWGTG